MAKKKKTDGAKRKIQKVSSKKRINKISKKKAKRKETSVKLSGNVRADKRRKNNARRKKYYLDSKNRVRLKSTKGYAKVSDKFKSELKTILKPRPEKVEVYIDGAGRFRNVKDGKYAKLSVQQKEQLRAKLKPKNRKVAPKPKAEKIKWSEIESYVHSANIRSVLLNPEFINKKIVITDVFNFRFETVSQSKALEIIEDNNIHLYNIVDLIREAKKISSPEFLILIKEKINLSSKNKEGQRQRILRIDYKNLETNIDTGLFEGTLNIYRQNGIQ